LLTIGEMLLLYFALYISLALGLLSLTNFQRWRCLE